MASPSHHPPVSDHGKRTNVHVAQDPIQLPVLDKSKIENSNQGPDPIEEDQSVDTTTSEITSDSSDRKHLNSYPGFLELNPDDHDLHDTLETLLTMDNPSKTTTNVTVFDIGPRKVDDRGEFSKLNEDFEQILLNPATDIVTRILVVESFIVPSKSVTEPGEFDIDRPLVNFIATYFDIPLQFLMRHFLDERIHPLQKRAYTEAAWNAPQQLAELHFASRWKDEHHDSVMSYLEVHDKRTGLTTVLLWLRTAESTLDINRSQMRPSEGPASYTLFTQVCIDKLKHASEDVIVRGNESPLDFVLPCIEQFFQLHCRMCKECHTMDRPGEGDAGGRFKEDLDSAENALYDLENFVFQVEWLKSSEISAEAKATLDWIVLESRQLKSFVDKKLNQLQSRRQSFLVELQMTEARTSTRSAVAVTRLSYLAGFYFPLALATSAFGMNLAVLGQGTASIGSFVATVVVLLVLNLFPMATILIKLLANSHIIEVARYTLAIAKCSYRQAFWFLGLCFFYGHATAVLASGCAHFEESVGVKRCSLVNELHVPKAGRDQMKQEVYVASVTSFWEQKAEDIYKLLDKARIK